MLHEARLICAFEEGGIIKLSKHVMLIIQENDYGQKDL